MMKIILPVVIALVGLGAGVGAGIALRPEPQMVAMEDPCGEYHVANKEIASDKDADKAMDDGEIDPSLYDFVRLNNQFVVPIVVDSRVASLVVLSLTIQVAAGQTEALYAIEPKLRDELLQVMFDHANAGGFNGPFTEAARMRILRTAMLEAAQKLGSVDVSDILITNVVRQDA